MNALESFRNKLHRIACPLPLPTAPVAAHEIILLGGREGERDGQDETKRPYL